jgi:carbonic anhydrase
VAVVHHSECGMARATDEELRRTVQEATGRQPEGIDFLTIDDPEEALRGDVESLRGSGLLPGGTEVHGFHYDVRTGRLRKVI